MGIDNNFDHALTLMNNLSAMRDDDSICDFTVKVGGKLFRLHRVVLAACSDYFKAMVSSEMKESLEGCCDLKEIDAEVFKCFLDYVYTGKVNVTPSMCCDVLRVSDILQCSDLKGQCVRFIGECLSSENCLRVKTLAEELSITSLANHAEQFSVEHFDTIITTDDFKSLDIDEFVDLVRKSSEHVEILWRGVVSWTSAAEENRMAFLPDILTLFDPENCTFDFLHGIIWTESLVHESETCEESIAKAILSVLEEQHLTTKNYFELLQLAHRYGGENDSNLETITLYVANHVKDVAQTSEFNFLGKYDVTRIFEHFTSWTPKNWKPLIKWVRFDGKNRKEHLATLLESRKSADFKFAYESMLNETVVKKYKRVTAVITSFTLSLLKASDLSLSNWFRLLQLAKMADGSLSGNASKEIFKFVNRNFAEIRKQDNFFKMEGADLLRLLQGMEIGLPGSGRMAASQQKPTHEEEVWVAISGWIKYKKAPRLSYLKNILETLKLEKFRFDYLLRTVLPDPILVAFSGGEVMVVSAMFSVLKYRDITTENCFQILSLARKYAARVVNDVRQFLKSNFEQLWKLEGFLNISHGDILYLLKSSDLNSAEQIKWNASRKWLNGDPSNREKFLPLLLKEIKLETLSHEFLQTNIFSDSSVKQSEECKTMIIDALFKKASDCPVVASPTQVVNKKVKELNVPAEDWTAVSMPRRTKTTNAPKEVGRNVHTHISYVTTFITKASSRPVVHSTTPVVETPANKPDTTSDGKTKTRTPQPKRATTFAAQEVRRKVPPYIQYGTPQPKTLEAKDIATELKTPNQPHTSNSGYLSHPIAPSLPHFGHHPPYLPANWTSQRQPSIPYYGTRVAIQRYPTPSYGVSPAWTPSSGIYTPYQSQAVSTPVQRQQDDFKTSEETDSDESQ